MKFARLTLGVVFAVVSIGFLGLSYGALKNLWGYTDSSPGAYILVSSIALLLAIGFGAAAFTFFRRTPEKRP